MKKSLLLNISKDYNLGELDSFELISEGLVNYNYSVKTSKGEFIFRFLGRKVDSYKLKKIELEFKVLNFLKRKNFTYEVPAPIKNIKGEYLSQYGSNSLWVYKKIKGERIHHPNTIEQIKEMARAIAIYHKKLKDFPSPSTMPRIFSLNWLNEKYTEMQKVRSKRKVDLLMKKNLPFFKKLMIILANKDLKKDVLPIHGDIHGANVLFVNEKMVAIIDFDNLQFAPKMQDVSYTIRQSCFSSGKPDGEKIAIFLKEYKKINNLSNEEIKAIPFLMLRDNCIVFWWFYSEMKKNLNKQCDLIKWTAEAARNTVKYFKIELK